MNIACVGLTYAALFPWAVRSPVTVGWVTVCECRQQPRIGDTTAPAVAPYQGTPLLTTEAAFDASREGQGRGGGVGG